MTRLIVLETSATACSVGLLCDGHVTQRITDIPRQHAQVLLSWVEELLKAKHISLQDCDAIAFSAGPGQFTGIRIGASAAQALAYALNKPVLVLDSLQVIAQSAHRLLGYTQVSIAMDAYRDEIYYAQYQYDEHTQLMRPSIMPSLRAAKEPAVLSINGEKIGDAWKKYWDIEAPMVMPEAQDGCTLAGWMWQEGLVVAPEQAQPIYLRDEVTY